MSYNSVHMDHPISGGYRRSQLQRCTVAKLSRTTWAELRLPDPYLNGNTKWQEMAIVAFFFKSGFIIINASKDIGYYTDPTTGSIPTSFRCRLDKVNTKALLSFGIKLMMSGRLKKDWAWLLDPKRKPRSRTRRGGGPLSKHRIIFSKAIVTQAITKYGLNKVCWKLRVDMKVIRFWRDYKI